MQSVQTQELPSGPHERIEVDHIISCDNPSADDEVVTPLYRDRFSGVVWSYPAASKAKAVDEVEEAIRHFCGKNTPVVSVASDRAPEILKAVR